MYCSKCGKKLKKDAKACSSCGEKVSVQEMKDRRKPAEVEIKIVQPGQVPQPRPKPNSCVTAITVVFVISIAIVIFGYASGDTAVASSFGALFVVLVSLILFIWLISFIAQKLIKMGLKKPIVSLIILGILIVLAIPAYISYRNYTYKSVYDRIFFLEDKVTEISAAKLHGDSLMLDGAIANSGVTLKKVNDAAIAEKSRINETSYSTELNGYKGVAVAWADKIAASKDIVSWKALPNSPEKFETLLSDAWLEKIFEQTFYDIAAVKDAGDIAIKKQDRVAMRFVAARLIAIDHLLTSIETYQSVADSGFITPAYADYITGSRAVMRTRKLCFMNGKAITCLPEAEKAVKSAKDVATKMYVFTPPERYTALPDTNISETGWDGSFAPIEPALDDAGVQYLGGAGITQGEPDVGPQLSPREIAFRNDCRSKGGNPDPTSITKTRIPTTESGYDCQIGSCWEFMTAVSGRTYAGGASGCPEVGLVPKAPVTIPDLIPDITPGIVPSPTPGATASWDGTYSLTYSLTCNVPGVGSIPTPSTSESITVRNGRFTPSGGSSASISSSGQAQSSMSMSEAGAYGRMVDNYQFSHNGSGVTVRGTRSFSGGGSDTVTIPGTYGSYTGSASIGCSGTISGSRR